MHLIILIVYWYYQPEPGKSLIGAGIVLEYNAENPIIICTKASLKYNWLQEINKFTDLSAKVIETPSKAGKRFNEQFENCKIYILNYETLRNDQVYEKLREYNVCGIVFDETFVLLCSDA